MVVAILDVCAAPEAAPVQKRVPPEKPHGDRRLHATTKHGLCQRATVPA
jgi:hypothetical protein